MNRILWMIFLVCTSLVAAAQSPQLEFVSQLGGTACSIDVAGTMIVLGQGPRLVMIDASDLANPIEIGRSAPIANCIEDLDVVDGYAYAAADLHGVFIFSLQDPAHPVVVGSMPAQDAALSVCVVGEMAYVADRYEGLSVFSLADKTAPVRMGWIDTPGRASDVAVVGDYAYVADGSSGLRVIAIADPSSLVEVAVLDSLDGAVALSIRDHVITVVDENSRFHTVSITDPEHPVLLATVAVRYPVDVIVMGEYACVSSNYRGIHVLSIADPAHPTEVGMIDAQGEALAVVDGSLCVAAGARGLTVYSLEDPSAPTVSAVLDTAFAGTSVDASADLVCVADYYEGVRILSTADSMQPVEIGFFALPEATTVDLDGNRLFVCAARELVIVDLADPTTPVELGRVAFSARPTSVQAVGGFAYVVCSTDGLHVISVADPAVPTLVASLPMDGYAMDVCVAGEVAFVAAKGLHIVSMADPLHPLQIGTLASNQPARSVTITGDVVFLSEGSLVRVIFVSDPAHPVEVGQRIFGLGAAVAIAGGTAVVGLEWVGVRLVSLLDLSNLPVLGGADTADRAVDIAIWGDLVYVADDRGGLTVLRLVAAGN